jgi:hypothetical protein
MEVGSGLKVPPLTQDVSLKEIKYEEKEDHG